MKKNGAFPAAGFDRGWTRARKGWAMLVVAGVMAMPAFSAPPWRASDAAVFAYDTGTRLPAAPGRDTWKARAGWTESEAPAEAHGDWVLANRQLIASVRIGAAAVEAVAYDADTLWEPVFELSPNVGAFRGRIVGARLLAADAEAGARLSVTWSDGTSEKNLRLVLPFDHPSLNVGTEDEEIEIQVRMQGEHAIAADMRGYDAVVSPGSVEADIVRIPAGSRAYPSFIQTLTGGNALLVTTLPQPEDIRVRRGAATDGTPVFTEMRTRIRPGAPVWLSAPAAPGIWYAGDATALSRTRDKEPDWTPPFPAQWRLCLSYTSGLYAGHSIHFDALYVLPDERLFTTETRWTLSNPRRWSSTRGYYTLPLQIEGDTVRVRTPRFQRGPANGTVEGPYILYPNDRNIGGRTTEDVATPIRAVCVRDVIQATLGEERMADYARGRRMNPYHSTCDTTALIEGYVTQGEAFENEEEIRERGATLGPFIVLHRSRIDEYREWAEAFEAFCDRWRTRAPGNEAVREAMDNLLALTDVIPAWFEGEKDSMGTAELTEKEAERMVAAALSRDEDREAVVDAAGRQIRIYGGKHDHGLSEYRAVLQMFRQQALRMHLTERDTEARRFLRESLEFSEELLKPYWRYENRA